MRLIISQEVLVARVAPLGHVAIYNTSLGQGLSFAIGNRNTHANIENAETTEDRSNSSTAAQRKTAPSWHSGRPLQPETAEDRSNPSVAAQRKTAPSWHSGRPPHSTINNVFQKKRTPELRPPTHIRHHRSIYIYACALRRQSLSKHMYKNTRCSIGNGPGTYGYLLWHLVTRRGSAPMSVSSISSTTLSPLSTASTAIPVQRCL